MISIQDNSGYDGVICFGGADWWYHNRGHYDMQMCRQLSRRVPVLYVNSIGVRLPSLSEGGMFFRRVSRKVKSWSRGFAWIDDRFGVVSPISLPGQMHRGLSRQILVTQVRAAGRRMEIARPLLWVECPSAVEVIDDLPRVGLVYQRTDRYEEFPGVDADKVRGFDRALKEGADLTLFCSRSLLEEESRQCRNAKYVDHGVDFTRFHQAGVGQGEEPDDVRSIIRPRVGFVGGIDAHTFDASLFVNVARRLPEAQFVLVGKSSLPADWCGEPNVHLLGQRPYESVASYMAACDVLIMPWNQNQWIQACNPIKLKEYLAVGRPVVSTPFAELSRYGGLVSVATDCEAFAQAVWRAIDDPGDAQSRVDRVRAETWSAKAEHVVNELAGLGIEPMAATAAALT